MNRAPTVSLLPFCWMSRRAVAVSIAVCLLACPARSPAQDAGVSGIPPGPANPSGLNNVLRDPSGIGNAAKIPALPQPRIAPVVPPALAPSSGGYRSFYPAAGYRAVHVPRTAKTKRTSHARKSRRSSKAHARKEDTRTDHGVVSICRGC